MAGQVPSPSGKATSPTPCRQVRPFLVSTQSHVLEEKGRLFEDAKRVRAGAMFRRYRIILGDRVRVRWPTFQALEEENWWFLGKWATWFFGGTVAHT